MCSVIDKVTAASKKAAPAPAESTEPELPCNLCGINVNSGEIGRNCRGNRSNLRGLVLCYGCDRELAGGKFSAPIVQDEHRAMNRGTMLIDRPPLPKKILHCINGPAIGVKLAAKPRPGSGFRDAASFAPRPAKPVAAELTPPPAPSPIDPLPIPETRVSSPTPEPEPVKVVRTPRPSRKPRQPRPAAPADSTAADSWRTNGARIAALAYV